MSATRRRHVAGGVTRHGAAWPCVRVRERSFLPGVRAWQSAQTLLPGTFCTSSCRTFSLRACWRFDMMPDMSPYVSVYVFVDGRLESSLYIVGVMGRFRRGEMKGFDGRRIYGSAAVCAGVTMGSSVSYMDARDAVLGLLAARFVGRSVLGGRRGEAAGDGNRLLQTGGVNDGEQRTRQGRLERVGNERI